MATLDLQVSATADDGQWVAGGSLFASTNLANDLGDDANNEYSIFLYFVLTADLAGATITESHLEGRAHATRTDNINFHIYGHDADNPAAPTTVAEADAAPVTTANTAVAFTTDITAGTFYTLGDVTAILQELVDSYGPLDTERLGFLLKNDGGHATNVKLRWTDLSGGAGLSGKLHIEYTAAGGDGLTPGLLRPMGIVF